MLDLSGYEISIARWSPAEVISPREFRRDEF